MQSKLKSILESMINDLKQDKEVTVDPQVFPCFRPNKLKTKPHITDQHIKNVFSSLTKDDIPTFKRAIEAIEKQESAWLGFKLVTDKCAATKSVDTKVTDIQGQGSADAFPGIFFATEDRDIVFSRNISDRDKMQMLDITRGPQMHDEQFEGVSWCSVPLFSKGRVFILGASNVSVALARYADDVEFEVFVVDYDEHYLSEARFPDVERILIPSFDKLHEYLDVTEDDYICVLTRGHMYDPEALIFGVETGAHYVGMLGHPIKNERVMKLCEEAGHNRADFEDKIYAPIGLEFGAKGATELGICIVAQLIQVRAERRKQADA